MINIYDLLHDSIENENKEDVRTILSFLENNDNVGIFKQGRTLENSAIFRYIDYLIMNFEDTDLVLYFIKIIYDIKKYISKNDVFNYVQHLKRLINSGKLNTQTDVDFIKNLIKTIESEFLKTTKFEEHFDSFIERLKKADINKSGMNKKINETEDVKKWPLEKIYEDLLTNSKITKMLNDLGFAKTIESIISKVESTLGISEEKKEKVINTLESIYSPKELMKYLTNSMLNSSSNLSMSRGLRKPSYNSARY